ncbi:helix-turn-helix domain-containing protein [Halobacillus sp. A5]|uniref:helix-turn-helix domain-containing protein n=1 Tax=Halobacillus sp. A5 TaxID=2880263 RepID=UPI0020A64F52|nr:helix-turn-helix transcriptional regulator [Halobacillus sp. A5]MCP3029196.1 helix-turn-helix domain-containing protein [Halobacillus sp. A5]
MIGTTIHKIRRGKGISLSELAKKANISKSNLSNIERNVNKNPSITLVKKIADVLEVDLYDLLHPERDIHQQLPPLIEYEWVQFVYDLKKAGVQKEQLPEYKHIIEFIHWKKQQEDG